MTKSEKRSGHPYQSELKEKIREKIKQENISASCSYQVREKKEEHF